MYAIMGGKVSQPQYSQPHYYHGLSAADLGVEVNPQLWFKDCNYDCDLICSTYGNLAVGKILTFSNSLLTLYSFIQFQYIIN